MNLFGRIRNTFVGPRVVTHEEFIAQLQRFVDHKEGKWEWDDFESIPIADSELEGVRFEICKRGVPPHVSQEAYDFMRECIEKLRPQ